MSCLPDAKRACSLSQATSFWQELVPALLLGLWWRRWDQLPGWRWKMLKVATYFILIEERWRFQSRKFVLFIDCGREKPGSNANWPRLFPRMWQKRYIRGFREFFSVIFLVMILLMLDLDFVLPQYGGIRICLHNFVKKNAFGTHWN